MWRKQAASKFFPSLKKLTSEQRATIHAIIDEIVQDPDQYENQIYPKPLTYPNGDREIEVAGVWLRYRIDRQEQTIVVLQVS